MPYILQGTKDLVDYWKTLGRPCARRRLAEAVKASLINFEADGKGRVSFNHRYGEVEAQNLAAALGVTVANVTTNGGQILI